MHKVKIDALSVETLGFGGGGGGRGGISKVTGFSKVTEREDEDE